MDITIERVGLGIKMRSIFVVVAISLFWSASVKAGGRWIDANKEACPDICKADKGENGGAPEQNAVPIGGRHQYYVGSNDGTACIVAGRSGPKTLARYKCLCTSDKV